MITIAVQTLKYTTQNLDGCMQNLDGVLKIQIVNGLHCSVVARVAVRIVTSRILYQDSACRILTVYLLANVNKFNTKLMLIVHILQQRRNL